MAQVQIKTPAPDFTLTDLHGENFTLADWQGKKNIVLVFNRGFV